MNLLGAFAIALLLQQPGTASITGTVVQMGSAQPLLRAVVETTGGSLREPSVMTTGADGKFEFRNLPPGRYQVKVSRTGYQDSRAIAVEAGQSVKDIRVALVPYGSLSGRVYDANGEPMAQITVQALKYSYSAGAPVLTAMRTDQTDDRGEYRLYWLPPGTYYVAAVPLGSSDMVLKMFEGATHRVAERPPGTGSRDAYSAVYYPGTADVQGATSLEVRPGGDFGGVDFSLSPVRQRTVRGLVVNGSTGQPVTSASVALVPRTASVTGALNARPTSNGMFEIQGAFPGSYFLSASARIDAGGGAVRIVGGRTPVEIGSADVDGLVVSLLPSVDIAGQVITEGVNGVNNSAPDDHHSIVSLKSDLSRTPGRPSELAAPFKGNGQFVVDDAIEGDYQVLLSDLPRGTYVKAVRFGTADVLNNRLRLESRSTDRLEVVLATNGGVLDGTVVDENHEPATHAVVALVPDASRRQRGDLYKSVASDSSGRFHFDAIAPGDYLVFAWREIEEGSWRDPDFLRRNEASGKLIHFAEGGRESVELNAVPFAY
jgi:hypothetical protein